MATFRTQFSRKLYIAFGILLMITLAIAWYFFDSVNWYRYDLQRISKSNEVLHGYEALANLTARKLLHLTEAVNRVSVSQPLGEGDDAVTLRIALNRIQQGIAEEVAFVRDQDESTELEALSEIGRVVEQVIRAGQQIDQALALDRPRDAEAVLAALRSDGIGSHFQVLIQRAIDERRAEVRAANLEAMALANYITHLLPALMTVLVIITVIVGFIFSRSLTRSLRLLQEAVTEFRSGNLRHRIPDIQEREFRELAQTFGTMANELHQHRTGLDDAHARLEGMIEERTRALQDSNRKLAEVDETRRKLLADISHEFRTPLTVIKGESEIALRGGNRTKAEYRESLERIVQQADHTTRLVDDLLFIARADAGEPRLDIRSVAIPSLVSEVCEDFRTQAEEKQVNIDFSGRTVKAVVRGDAGRLRQVFTILLDNALRYSHPGGDIKLSATAGQRDVTITIQDHGIGLSREEAAQAFERFFRGSRAVGHARGTGLGLPVAKAIVTAHGGSIDLRGDPGRGAVATVVLPIEGTLRAVA